MVRFQKPSWLPVRIKTLSFIFKKFQFETVYETLSDFFSVTVRPNRLQTNMHHCGRCGRGQSLSRMLSVWFHVGMA